jgi:hypothetical protein
VLDLLTGNIVHTLHYSSAHSHALLHTALHLHSHALHNVRCTCAPLHSACSLLRQRARSNIRSLASYVTPQRRQLKIAFTNIHIEHIKTRRAIGDVCGTTTTITKASPRLPPTAKSSRRHIRHVASSATTVTTRRR